MVVMPHPDDEAFSVSGTIKRLTQAGHAVVLVETTDGSAGQVHPDASQKLTELGSVKALRREELKQSATVLGINSIRYLDRQDGSLTNGDVMDNALVNQIADILTKETPDVVIAYDHTGISWHIDHVVTSLSTAKACLETRVADKVFLVTRPPSLKLRYEYVVEVRFPITHCVDITSVVEFKRQALMAHLSQKYDWERFFARQDNPSLKTEYFNLSQDNGRSEEIFTFFKPV